MKPLASKVVKTALELVQQINPIPYVLGGEPLGTYNLVTFTNNWTSANVFLTLFSMGGLITQII